MENRTLRVAAVQPALTVGDVGGNLRRIEALVRDAARAHDPDVVVLPESITTPLVYAQALRLAAAPVDGPPLQLLRRLSRELGCIVTGGFHAVRSGHAYATYALAEPHGALHLHNKRSLALWERNYVRPGTDDGIASTCLGRVGSVAGSEWERSDTAASLRGEVRLVLGGMCAPGAPDWRLTRPWLVRRERPIQLELARALPSRMARMTGVPTVIAAQVGDVTFGTPLLRKVAWNAAMLGETQICDRDGTVLARLTYEDGEGHVSADVQLLPAVPLEPVPHRTFSALQPLSHHLARRPAHLHGALKYAALRAARLHPWQTPHDLPATTAAPDGAEVPELGRTFAAPTSRPAAPSVAPAPARLAPVAEDPPPAPRGHEASVWLCELCNWIYDPDEGDPDGGIAPGTAFEDIPDDWICPECGARKSDFRLVSLEEVAA